MDSAPRRLVILALALLASINISAQVLSVDPAKMIALGTVDERFQSYNIEMVEVTGGRFWKPYSSHAKLAGQAPSTPQVAAPIAGLGSDLFEYRPPIDLSNSRLRKLAAALGPAYVRVSGSWANSVYFHDSDDAASTNAPSGFGSVLTGKQWKGVIEFSRATDAQLVTSFAISPGTRDANGQWTPEQARKVLAYTKSVGGRIAAAEFMNEPNLPSFGGAPKGYDAAAYARDLAIFRPFLKQNSPETLLSGPGSTAETPNRPPRAIPGLLTTDALLTATGPAFDVFDYHLYAAVSQRCAQRSPGGGTSAADALSSEWLSRSEKIAAFYSGLRDQYEPGKPIWITETADTACGGNPWASTFLDTFRYLVQHGRLAQMGVKVIMHNTLAASDYGLLDEKTFEPRPNYWAALLWRKLMGSTVLDPHAVLEGVLPLVLANSGEPTPGFYAYAHCLQGHRGGVALLLINADQQHTYQLNVPIASESYALTAQHLEDKTVFLNGKPLALRSDDDLPQLTAERIHPGKLDVAPRSITFLAIGNANNSACR